MRGSEWSRWDLHVHTPASLVQSYGANDDLTWERFLTDLEALPAEVTVVGINDYLEVEGYKRVCAERDAGRLQNLRLVLPVIEFRIARFAGQAQWQRVNFHVVFSDQVDPSTIEQELLSSLNREYTLDDGNVWSGPPLRDRLAELGRRIKQCGPPPTDPASDLLVGFHNFNVDPEDMRRLLERSNAFRGRYVTAVGLGEWSQLRWDGSAAEKRSIVNTADFVLTATSSPASFDRGRQALMANTVQSRLLHSSDAHFFSDATEPNRIGRSLTWIKALPTFEGLLLARHEYEHRVFVGSGEPPQLQAVRESPTKFIRSVSFVRAGGEGPPWFNGQDIHLNPGLVAIIGNKGSGKSALGDAIALVGNADVEDHLSFLSANRFRNIRTGSASEFTCRLGWESGDSETRNLGEHVDGDKPERVRYLPQNYFERLCSDVAEDSVARRSVDTGLKPRD
ncbi:MAG: ATP-binding protein [Acidimicrobiales bacterium]